MDRKKDVAPKLELAVKVPGRRLTRQELTALRAAFRNILVATLDATEAAFGLTLKHDLKRVAKRVQVAKRVTTVKRKR
ncbi:MAG TPA: hypothetical protein VMT19_00425 [Thermoanaerobaculaceae bacterium]|nr:hypothetical protein [Thermoanaerobaculaceae bacterium]